MDLEERARSLYKAGLSTERILEELVVLTDSEEKAKAILNEITNTETITDSFISELCNYKTSGFSADFAGLGCRGDGDFFIHHKIAELIDNQWLKTLPGNTIIDPIEQDDGGVVQVGNDFITVSVDGMHSRLSHFPFIAGFHVARAAIRDTIVMGCMPKALFSDIHLANDGDVAKIFDYTAGITTVSELTEIPLIAGSTLRIGGDLVLGDRLTGCVGCVGFGHKLTPRKNTEPGDVMIMTEGSGGGTIATTALYNGFSKIASETLNLKFIQLGKKLLNSNLLGNVHSLTDVTNGGLRGDAFEISNTANVNISIYEDAFNNLINPTVIDMLKGLDIDPMGVSIDSLLLILPFNYADALLSFIHSNGISAGIIGCVEKGKIGVGQTPKVKLIKGVKPELGSVDILDVKKDVETIELRPHYREEPYTPIKKVVNIKPKNQEEIQNAIERSMNISKNKKEDFKRWLKSKNRV